ncbi:MAG: DUF3995 domain-containing protein, partial [Cyanobacteria bacterium P01_F01_bin.143]
MVLSILLSLIFLVLALVHFYWAFGGKLGFAKVLPTNEGGVRVLNPKKLDCALVGISLAALTIFYLLRAGFVAYDLPERAEQYGGWVVPILFLLRAIGEFKYVGFFKSVRNTNFGQLDTKFFSPLCLV